MNIFLRNCILSLLAALLLSCGGGGGGGSSGIALSGVAGVGTPGSAGGASAALDVALGGASGASGGLGGIASSTDGSSTTVSGGDDGSGVGSGGTGINTADATSVGAVDGAGSIIVNGLRYDTSATVGNLEDATNGLQLGMSVKVTGPVNADFTSGIARRVDSAVDIRGPLASVDLAQGSFVVLGTTVTTDDATVWADSTGLASIAVGRKLQIWGLPVASGVLRATRVEQHDVATPVITGMVQHLDTAEHTFTLGSVVIDYGAATLSGSLDGRPLSDGTIVRVRANGSSPIGLAAALVQWWYPVPNDTTVQLEGVVTNYAGQGSLRVLGLPVDASSAQITGGPAGGVGNGVTVAVGGAFSNGILRATQLKIRHVPGTGGPSSFNLIGTVGAFRSPSDFRVKGQPIDASGAAFVNGSAANLGNGAKVSVQGAKVVNGVLIANRVSFD